jgi:hypothetical protein
MELKPNGLHFSGHGVRMESVVKEMKEAKKKGALITDEMIKDAE